MHVEGEILFEKYKILRLLGSGALGDVYLAEDLQLDRQVAIKHLKAHLAADKAALEQFRREASVIARLKHQNIAVVHALEQDAGECYVVMEHAEEGTLEDLIESKGSLPIRLAIDITLVLCQALIAIHEKGILHRDIKPSNILLLNVGSEMVPKLCDFGLSLEAGLAGMKAPVDIGSYLSTLQYASPEQLRKERVDARSDLYSLGVVLYKMLTGKPPFTGDIDTITRGHLEQEPQPPSQIRAGILPSLDRAVLVTLRKKRSGRYQNAQEMREALEAAQKEEANKQEQLRILYAEAVQYLRREDWPAAIQKFRSILGLDPGFRDVVDKLEEAKAQQKLQRIYEQAIETVRNQDWVKAKKMLDEVHSLDPDYKDVGVKLEETKKQIKLSSLYAKAVQLQEDKRWVEASQTFVDILNIDYDYKDVAARLAKANERRRLQRLYEEANALFTEGQWREARDKFAEIQRADPGYEDVSAKLGETVRHERAEGLYVQGMECLERGDWQGAIDRFERINRFDRGYSDVDAKLEEAKGQKKLQDLYDEGMAYYGRRDWEKAIEKFARLQDLAPDYRRVAELLEGAKQRQKLEELEDKAKSLAWKERLKRWNRSLSDPVKVALVGLLGVLISTFCGTLGSVLLEFGLNRTPTSIPTTIAVAFPTSTSTATHTPTPTPMPTNTLAVPSSPTGLCNENFETSDFVCWEHGGELSQAVQSEAVYEGGYAMLLGSPDYPCLEGVPIGEAWICQGFNVPSDGTPELSFRYRAHSFDVEGSDSLDVYIDETLIQQIWNTKWAQSDCDPNKNGIQGEENEAWDTGWQLFSYALDDYKGQTITLCFRNVSRFDSSWNTWSYIDNVKVTP